MKNNLYFFRGLLVLLLLGGVSFLYAQTPGSTPCDAIQLYPSAIGDCNNSCGQQLCGQYQCESAACGNAAMPGTATIDGSCTADNDIGQACTWLEVTATAADLVIGNETNYSGPGANDIERKDYTIFSGSCGALTEVGCSAEVASGGSASFSGLTAGQTYYIQVTRSQASISRGCPTCNTAASCVQSSVPFAISNNSCSSPTVIASGSTINTTNANAAASNASVCQGPASGSVENNVWYQWCSGPNWIPGDTAFVHVFDQVCNNAQGLQMSVYNATTTCASINSGTANSTICENPGTTTDYNYFWVANPNECFFVTFDGFAGTACNFNIQISASDVILLSTDLAKFEAHNTPETVVLNWEMASSASSITNFVVERSQNAIDFEPIGSTPKAPSNNYSLVDHTPLPSVSYYRLKMLDGNGDVGYSTIVAVSRAADISKGKLFIHKIYPQPFAQNFTVDFEVATSTKVTFKIINALGQRVLEQPYSTTPASLNSVTLETSKLKAGIYTLILEDEWARRVKLERIVKQ